MDNLHEALYPVQFANRLLLQEIDRICRKHNIEYFLWGGTMLGAVRHKDFIPWDDDVDVIFKRKEYNKLKKVIKKELSPEFEYVYPGEDGVYHDMISRIIYCPSDLGLRSKEMDFYKGRLNKVCLDLFVLDNTAKGLLFKIQLYAIKALYGMAMAYRFKIDKSKYNLFEKTSIMLLSGIGKFIPLRYILKLYNIIMLSGSSKSSEIFISNDVPPLIHQHYMKKWFRKPVKGFIGDKEYPIPSGYHDILSYIYGDYMKYPPVKDQQPKHIDLLNDIKVYYKGELVKA